MINGKTKSGYKYKMSESALNDMEMLDLLTAIDDGEVQLMTKAADKLLGKEQRIALYDHIRDEEGRVPIDRFEVELAEIFSNPKLKNFLSSPE